MANTEHMKNINNKVKVKNQDKKGIDVSKLITLVYHSVKFPDPSLPNKPEFFDVADPGKNIMSFGRIKLFNDDVLKEVFGNKGKSPIYKMKLVRSRLQAFIDTYTFPYMGGLGNALPDTALASFTKIVDALRKQYNEAHQEYLDNWSMMREKCIQYFEERPHLYPGVSSEDMAKAIMNKLLSFSHDLDSKFGFQVTHFDVKPVEMSVDETDVIEKQAIIDARNEIAKKAGHDFNKMVNEFQHEVKADLRKQTVSAFSDLLKAIESDKWNQKSINATIAYIDKFKKLNFLNDTELEQFLEDQKKKIGVVSAQEIKKSQGSIDDLHGMVKGAVDGLKKLAKEEKEAIEKGFGAMGNRAIDPF